MQQEQQKEAYLRRLGVVSQHLTVYALFEVLMLFRNRQLPLFIANQ